ncbi:MAG TPA: MAP7 domain-containing protein, partial [Pyrinomonadaceae bacterium]|nr:MAP7 domain-containing protein [Pyrinomonadaceae bacterium]
PVTPVTFDTLLSANAYKMYFEARGVGQLVRSSAATDVLDPILKLGGPPSEFVDVVNWLKSHADELMTSRMMVAVWPTATDVPQAVIAIEFSSSEDATKFESQVNGILAKVLPPFTPPSPVDETDQPKPEAKPETKPQAPVPSYYLQRADSLILLSPAPVQLKKLRPKGSKLLSEDPNFQTAYNRFSSEPIFVYVHTASIQKEQEERAKQAVEEWKKEQEAQKAAQEKQKAEEENKLELTEEEKNAEMVELTPEPSPEVPPAPEPEPPPPTDAQILSNAFSGLRNNLMAVSPTLPNALGIGFSPDTESFDVRVLMIDAAGEHSDPIPIFSGLRLGGPVTPESPGILPGDSELVVMLSLNFPEIHELVSALEAPESYLTGEEVAPASTDQAVMQQPPVEFAAPLRTIERLTKINVKDELLPLLGSEVAVSMPMGEFGMFGPPVRGPRSMQTSDAASVDGVKPAPRTPFIVISLRDREGMRRLMPRILEGFAGKAAAALAQSEKREDTEIVSIANMFAYAFVGNFIVLGVDAATTRYVVDSYLKGETLAANPQFKNYTRWQPRQVQAHAYLSSAFADSYKTWANSSSAPISDEARMFLTRVSTNPQPITYSLSNDGLGALHELHVPKSLVITTIAGIASAENPPATVKNERQAMSMLYSITGAQQSYKENGKSGYGSLDDLIAAELISKDTLDKSGYKFEVKLVPDGYEISAVPLEYGKTGKLSFFMTHETHTIHGGDHGGAPASASDPQIGY